MLDLSLLTEIATREAAGELNLAGWLMSLPDPDPVLRKEFGYSTILSDLTADDQVCTAMQQRKLKTLLNRDYAFAPGAVKDTRATPQAEALCAALVQDLERVDLYNLIAQVLDAPYYGHVIAELNWVAEGAALRLADVRPKPRRWFAYDLDNALCFLKLGAVLTPVPANKFLVARHFPDFENPYGLRLLSRVLWPVAFKKGGVKFWVQFCEKYGFPWVVGTARQGAQDSERQAMAASLAQMTQDAVAVISSGCQVAVHEFGGKAGDLHEKFVSYWDAAISKVLMGQTLTAEIGATGSYAAAQAHYNVLGDLAKADSVLVETFFNELGWIYGQVNAGPDVLAPRFAFECPTDLQALATQSLAMSQAGACFTKSYWIDEFGLKAEHVAEPAPPASPGTPASAQAQAPALMASRPQGGISPVGRDDRPDPGEAAAIAAQQDIDALADALLRDAPALGQSFAHDLVQTLSRAESFDDAQILLAEALGQTAGANEFEKVLAAGMRAAHLAGQAAVRAETKADG